jgi:hypothetical protein
MLSVDAACAFTFFLKIWILCSIVSTAVGTRHRKKLFFLFCSFLTLYASIERDQFFITPTLLSTMLSHFASPIILFDRMFGCSQFLYLPPSPFPISTLPSVALGFVTSPFHHSGYDERKIQLHYFYHGF